MEPTIGDILDVLECGEKLDTLMDTLGDLEVTSVMACLSTFLDVYSDTHGCDALEIVDNMSRVMHRVHGR